ncbi:hypothetical protein HMPREF3225_00837 [Staphylococcus lugdunensis]|uniref:Uncharacterized protein n=1 Tax=Staphylococcus lugdunensis TaxID=28035 RepID=A0ABD4EGN2_STALU|nr:hypothetical protein HMPREF3225_00837 [Staphylococcus lugdunensis]
MREQDKLKTGAPTKRNAKSISSIKASWCGGPNKENFEKKFTKQSKLGWLKLSPKKASQQYEVLNKKKHSDELNSIHLSVIFLRFMFQVFAF